MEDPKAPVSFIGTLFNCEAATTYPDARTKESPRAPPGQLVLALAYLVQSGKFLQSQELLRTPNFAPIRLALSLSFLPCRDATCSSRLHGLLRLRKEIFITRIENVVLLISQESIVSLLVL